MKERNLYPIVGHFLSKELGCFKVAERKGNPDLGQADVIGVKNVGKDLLNEVEVIIVEVKKDIKGFGKKIGQALGYSLYANKCYLATRESFKEEHKDFATQLGVGLIQIKKNKCIEVLSAPIHIPNEYQKRYILWKLQIAKCTLCSAFFDIPHWSYTKKSNISLNNKKPYFIHRTQSDSKKGKQFLCPDCILSLQKIEGGFLNEDKVTIIKGRLHEKKLSKKLSQIGKLMDGLGDIQSVPRKGRLCYSLQGTNFLEIFPKKTCFIVRILTRRRKLKDKERIFKRKIGHKGGNIRVDKRTNVEYVIKLIKRAYKLELK